METVFDTPGHAALLTGSFIMSIPAREVFLNTKITGPGNYVEASAFNSKHECLRGVGKPFGEWPAHLCEKWEPKTRVYFKICY